MAVLMMSGLAVASLLTLLFVPAGLAVPLRQGQTASTLTCAVVG
jgi:hypothetical protein